MKLASVIRLLSAASLAVGSASAFALDEVEPNDTANEAQLVKSAWGGDIRVNAMMGSQGQMQHNDVDFYKFEAKAGDVLTIDIDNAYSPSAPLNTVVAIFSPGSYPRLLRMSDGASIDDGSTSPFDARIDNFVAPADGTYTVGVSSVPRYFYSGATTLSMPGMGERIVKDYTLDISGVSYDRVKKVNIEVRPGSDTLAPVNPRSKGKVPVAILGSESFSVMTVDADSVTFGATGDETSLHKCSKSVEDVNDDGFNDLVCRFENQSANFTLQSLEATLKGKTKSGVPFEGTALLKAVPRI